MARRGALGALESSHRPLRGFALGRLWTAFESLHARLLLAAVAATLASSLAVTWISTRSTESFLREEIDRKFPEILETASERLDLWYAQRQLDLDTFAKSRTLVRLFAGATESGIPGSQLAEASSYLAYVLERFPQFQALFALDLSGQPLVWVGVEVPLPEGLRSRLANVRGLETSGTHRLGDAAVQFSSAAMLDPGGSRIATLHALLDPAPLEAILASADLGAGGGIYVVAPDGGVVLAGLGASPRQRYRRALPGAEAPPSVEQYHGPGGAALVGAARAFERFGWVLVVEEPYVEAFAPVVALSRRTLAIDLVIVLGASLAALLMARSIVRPLVALSLQARRIAAGETEVVIPVSSRRDEIGVLTRALHEMTTRLYRNQVELQEKRAEIEQANIRLAAHNSQLQQVNEVLEQLSITDGLTRLHNHRFFQDHLPREVKRAERTGESLALLLIDIDDFKQLNDRHGHAAGDTVLRNVAEVMSLLVRDMDLLSRYGGEEFALLASQTDLRGGVALAEKIRQEIERSRFRIEDREGPHEVGITVSVGVAVYKSDPKAFFEEADQALYRAKRAGKNCVVVAGEDSARRQQ